MCINGDTAVWTKSLTVVQTAEIGARLVCECAPAQHNAAALLIFAHNHLDLYHLVNAAALLQSPDEALILKVHRRALDVQPDAWLQQHRCRALGISCLLLPLLLLQTGFMQRPAYTRYSGSTYNSEVRHVFQLHWLQSTIQDRAFYCQAHLQALR